MIEADLKFFSIQSFNKLLFLSDAININKDFSLVMGSTKRNRTAVNDIAAEISKLQLAAQIF